MTKERRNEPRMALVLPVRVQGHAEGGARLNLQFLDAEAPERLVPAGS